MKTNQPMYVLMRYKTGSMGIIVCAETIVKGSFLSILMYLNENKDFRLDDNTRVEDFHTGVPVNMERFAYYR